jgi:hypothetical protein
MRLLTWVQGILAVLIGLELSYILGRAWVWLWWVMLALYLVFGLALVVAALLHAASNSRGGVPAPPRFQPPAA